MTPGERISSILRDFMEAKGLTEQAFVDLSGIPKPTVKNIRGGKSNTQIDTLLMMANAGVPVWDIFESKNPDTIFSNATKLLVAYEMAPQHVRAVVDRALSGIDTEAVLSRFRQPQAPTKPKAP